MAKNCGAGFFHMAMKQPSSQNIEQLFLSEALGHSTARDIYSPIGRKIILPRRSMIDPRTIARLASEGIDRILVYRKPKISIIVVGNGLIAPGHSLSPGRSYDYGSAALKAALDTMRIRPVFTRCLPGEPKVVEKVVSFAINQSDMVILVVKELTQGIRVILDFLRQNHKQVFLLSHDLDQILDHFDRQILPAIRVFMGCVQTHPSFRQK